jgi:peroxiredoxin
MEKLPIGARAPMPGAEMKGVDGEMHSIRSAARENGVIVMFSGNTCPWVKAWEDRFDELAALAKENGVGMIAVNSNAGYRDEGDGMAAMKQLAARKDYPFPYVLDENARLADAFGATMTPDVFLFNGDLRLVYRGAIDDNARNAESVEEPYLRNALTAMTSGEEIPKTITKSIGCTIKR